MFKLNFTTEILYDVNSKEWDNVLSRVNYSTAFQTANYYKPNQLIRDCKPFYIIVKNDHGEIVGQLSGLIDLKDLQITTNKISKILIDKLNLDSRIIWDHGPIIHDNVNRKEIISRILTALDELAEENNIEMIKGTSCPLDSQCSVEIFKNFGYECKPWITYIINLAKGIDHIAATLDKKIRYDLRKAEEQGLVFELAQKRSDLDEFGELKYKLKKKYSPVQYSELEKENTWNVWYKEGIRKLFLVRFNNKLIGGVNVNSFNGNLYQTSVINEEKELQGGTFLTWKTIVWAAKMKNKTLDLGGVNPNPSTPKEKGIYYYKVKWGGEKFEQMIFVKIFHKNKKKFASLVTNPSLISSKLRKFLSNWN